MGEETVTHPGVVKKIEGDKAEISVISKASCISCSLKNVCSVSDMKEKIIEVNIADLGGHHEGENVVVEMKQSYGTWAVLLGYFFPFLVLFFGLMLFLHLGFDQGLAGILAIAMLIPYYGGLYLLRHYFKKHFRYQVR